MKEICNFCGGLGSQTDDRSAGACWACYGSGVRLVIDYPKPTPEQIAAKAAEDEMNRAADAAHRAHQDAIREWMDKYERYAS